MNGARQILWGRDREVRRKLRRVGIGDVATAVDLCSCCFTKFLVSSEERLQLEPELGEEACTHQAQHPER